MTSFPQWPEYVACIRSVGSGRTQDNPACGRSGTAFLQSVDHARNSREYGSRLVACPDCLRAFGQIDFAASEAALIDMNDVEEEDDE